MPLYNPASGGGGEVRAVCQAGDGYVEGTGAALGVDNDGAIASVNFSATQNNNIWHCNFIVPKGAQGKGISKIELYYKNLAASSLNINGLFQNTTHFTYSNGGTRTIDSTNTQMNFASPGTANQLGIITAPADSFNGLPATFNEGEIICVSFNRQGADAADTYNQVLHALAMVITFA
jgi:hypothetical protein